MMKACTALLGQCPRVSSTASRRACTTMFAGQANTVATRRGCRGALRAANPASTLANQRNRQRASGPTSSRPSSLRHNVRGIRGYVPGRLRQWCATQLAASADITWSSASIESKDQVGKDRCVVFGATTRPPATSGRRSAPPSSSPAAPSLTPPPFPRSSSLKRYKLVVDVGEVAKGYTVPGQYVQVRSSEDQKPAFIALANAPADTTLVEMVIKTNDGTAGAICGLDQGSELDVSPVMGKGFRVEERAPLSSCKHVYLIATGTGIAPIRALIDSGELDIPSRDSVTLYYGYRNNDYCAYGDEIAKWESMGIRVVPVLSEPESGWEGAKGYVQDSFKTTEKLEDPEGVVAVIAGQYELAGIISEIFKEAQVPEDRVLLNF